MTTRDQQVKSTKPEVTIDRFKPISVGMDCLAALRALSCLLFAALFSSRIFWDRSQPIIAFLKTFSSDSLFNSLLPIRCVFLGSWLIMAMVHFTLGMTKNKVILGIKNCTLVTEYLMLALLVVRLDHRHFFSIRYLT